MDWEIEKELRKVIPIHPDVNPKSLGGLEISQVSWVMFPVSLVK